MNDHMKPINFNNTPHHGPNNVSIYCGKGYPCLDTRNISAISSRVLLILPTQCYEGYVMWALYVRVVYGMVSFMGKSWHRKDVCEDGWGLDDMLNVS